MRHTMSAWLQAVALLLVCLSHVACGDDDDGTSDPTAGTGGTAGAGGAAGTSTAGTGGRAGSSGRGSAGTGSAGTMAAAMCSEPAPTAPVVCGGQTCAAPTDFPMNPCVVPCCVDMGGVQACGAKSTAAMYPAECTLAAAPDPSCPPFEAMGTTFAGCCNVADGKCGIVSTVRPGCITQSALIMLPDPPLTCDGASDGGVDDAGL